MCVRPTLRVTPLHVRSERRVCGALERGKRVLVEFFSLLHTINRGDEAHPRDARIALSYTRREREGDSEGRRRRDDDALGDASRRADFGAVGDTGNSTALTRDDDAEAAAALPLAPAATGVVPTLPVILLHTSSHLRTRRYILSC